MPLEEKELEASLARNDSLEKENLELKQEVARLKAQIISLKAHDNERKSMLWKKLHNSRPSFDESNFTETLSPWKSSDFMKVSEQNLEPESFQELSARKDRQSKIMSNIPFISPSPKEVKENKLVKTPPSVPAPPPPPLPSKLLGGLRSVCRVPEVVELYRSLTRKDANVENKTNNVTATPALAFTRNMIGEIENRSTYVSAVSSF